jgi:hypothetical protein
MDGGGGCELRSEFGRVRVGIDLAANGPRLRVESVREGSVIYLDPFELECLTHWHHRDLRELVLGPAYEDDAEQPDADEGE